MTQLREYNKMGITFTSFFEFVQNNVAFLIFFQINSIFLLKNNIHDTRNMYLFYQVDQPISQPINYFKELSNFY